MLSSVVPPASPFDEAFLRRLRALVLRVSRLLAGPQDGGRRGRAAGGRLDYRGSRPFAPGDDFRRIDWNVYGRFSEFFVREFTAERQGELLLVPDLSRSMAGDKDVFGRRVAAVLGVVALAGGHAVRLALPEGRGGGRALRGGNRVEELLERLAALPAPDGREPVLPAPPPRGSGAARRMVAILSDFLVPETGFRALEGLGGRSGEVVLIQVLHPAEWQLPAGNAMRFVDAETGERLDVDLDAGFREAFPRRLEAHIAALRGFAEKRGMIHVLLGTDHRLEDEVLALLRAGGVLG